MEWLEISVDAKGGDTEALTALLSELGEESLVIEDGAEFESFLENNRKYWDYVDEDCLERNRGVSRAKLYLSDDAAGRARMEELRGELERRGFHLTVSPVRDEDWENNWKKYYRPMEIGSRLLVVPEWEDIPPHEGRAVLRLNPGLIFGTGSHPTTAMCLKEIEKYAGRGKRALDLGCGSGILGVAALLLGCDSSTGCDIDEKAPHTAEENARLSGVAGDKFKVFAGDVLSRGEVRERIEREKYHLVLANIVADVIIALAPSVPGFMEPDGVFICSGIIEGRQTETEAALKKSGLRITGARHEGDWYCFTCRRGF